MAATCHLYPVQSAGSCRGRAVLSVDIRSNNKKTKNMENKIKELTDLLEEYLPPHLIEEVRERILDILQ